MKLTLVEHGRLDGVPLTDEQVATLLTTQTQLTLSPTPGRAGRYDIKAGSCVGVVRAGALDLEIQPKVPVGNLMFLLSHATDHQRVLPLPASVSEATTIHEAAAGWFEILIQRAFQRGVLQGYREEEQALMSLRGRALFDEQLRRRPLHQLPHECRFDDFTEDTALNRVLRAALRLLLGLPILSIELRRKLLGHDAELERVRHVRYSPQQLPTFHFDRLNEHYQPAVELALILLSARSPTARLGSTPVSALMFDMNQVFETFLHRALQRALGLDDRSFPQQSRRKLLHLDRDRRVKLEPDLSWWHRSQCLWIGDAKYKRATGGMGPNADVYQAVSYCHGAGLSRATLIYADGVAGKSCIAVETCNVTVEILALDLSSDPHELIEHVQELADEVRSQAREALANSRATQHLP